MSSAEQQPEVLNLVVSADGSGVIDAFNSLVWASSPALT
jgi:hypothetical protein